MTKYHITRKSSNSKTGPIPVTTTSKDSCPTTCSFYEKGCYAKNGPLNIHWNKVTDTDRGIDGASFLKGVSAFPKGQLWRHNQAGDLPNFFGAIDKDFVEKLTSANKGKRGFTYTHHEPTPHNLATIKTAISGGFSINLSANDPDHAVELAKHGVPVCAVVPSGESRTSFEYKGEKFLACPATYRDAMTCEKCGLCQKMERKDYIIYFPAHGTQKKSIDKMQEIL